MNYGRYFAMIATSTLVMFGLMYLNTYLLSHVFWSETQAYMAFVMGASMAVVMLSMYSSRRINLLSYAGAILAGDTDGLAGLGREAPQADMRLSLDDALEAGYCGRFGCSA